MLFAILSGPDLLCSAYCFATFFVYLTHAHAHTHAHTHAQTHTHAYAPRLQFHGKHLLVQVHALQALGVNVWIDEEMMTGRIQQKMTEGIDDSESVLVFVTEEYILKVRQTEVPFRNTPFFMCLHLTTYVPICAFVHLCAWVFRSATWGLGAF